MVPITALPWRPCFSLPSFPADIKVPSSHHDPDTWPVLGLSFYLTQRAFGAISWSNLKPM